MISRKRNATSDLSTEIVPYKTRLIYILKLINSLEHQPITSFNEDDLKNQVNNLLKLEEYCGFIPIRIGTKSPPHGYKYAGKPHSTLVQALKFKPGALAVKSPNLLTLDYDKISAFEYAMRKRIDFTSPTWHIKRTDQQLRYKQVFLVPDEMLLELPNGFIKRKVNYENTGLDIFLNNSGYIIFSGQHEDQKGNYYSPTDLGVSNLTKPPKEVWDLVLEIASEEDSKIRTKKFYSNTKSKRLNPCPICGRDKRLWCSESPGGLIWCFKGSTFDAELKHGLLKIGDFVNGYALVAQSDICNTFKFHESINRPIRKVKIRRFYGFK